MDQPHSRHVPNTMCSHDLPVSGLRWHGPISVVGTSFHGYGHALVAPPRIWGRGIRNGARPPFRSPSSPCYLGVGCPLRIIAARHTVAGGVTGATDGGLF